MSYFQLTPPTQYGWVCPVCGRGNAPWSSMCYCNPTAILTTTHTDTGTKPPQPPTTGAAHE